MISAGTKLHLSLERRKLYKFCSSELAIEKLTNAERERSTHIILRFIDVM